MSEYQKFKNLLEYFVAHLEYVNDSNPKRGSDQYIKPIVDKNKFYFTGQGYNGGNIQSQIKGWDIYENGEICINIQQNFGDYKTKKCYLNWKSTGINIIAKWENEHIDKLALEEYLYWLEPKERKFHTEKTIDALGLFDNTVPNDTLINLFNEYEKLLIQYITDEKNKKNMETIKPCIDLLETSKNLILTGAPGVGKTYKTAEIAVTICDGIDKLPTNRTDLMKRYRELLKNGQIAFTTFHQSLDYEEFVEGLKPDIDNAGNGTGNYSVKCGIFKEISKKAHKNILDSQKTQKELSEETELETILDHFLEDAIDKETEFEYDKRNQGQINKFVITPHSKSGDYFYAEIINNQTFDKQIISKEDVIKVLKNAGKITKATDIMRLFQTRYKYQYTFIFQIFELLKKKINTDKSNLQLPTKIEKQNFVLIIDEVNRGNISKIFGELITLLEKDKRLGEENEITVTLPYSQETFGVPSNLYIIGTMNTADRSIGHIDYAIRRRFAFFSIKADRSIIENYAQYKEDTKQQALNLFDNIKNFISDNINADLDAEDLMLGHSYFLCNTSEELKMRLEYEIIPLIEEYEKDGIIMLEKSELKTKFEEWKTLR